MPQLNPPAVLVTRPAHQAGPLTDLIERRGWHAVRVPTLEIVPIALSDNGKPLLQRLHDFDVVVFISPNAVNFALQAIGGKIEAFDKHRIAAVGLATARALKAAGLTVSWVPSAGYNSEALLALPEFQTVAGQSFLIVRGQGGRELLADTLRVRGAKVDYLEVYKRIKPACGNRELVQLLERHELDVITVTSGESLLNLMDMIGLAGRPEILALPLVVVSERIKNMAEAIGFKRILISDGPTDTAILEKLLQCVNGEYRGRSE